MDSWFLPSLRVGRDICAELAVVLMVGSFVAKDSLILLLIGIANGMMLAVFAVALDRAASDFSSSI